MTILNFIETTLIAAFGGSIGSVLTLISNYKLNKTKTRITELENKIFKLYGPLSFNLFYMTTLFQQFFSTLEGSCNYANDTKLADTDEKAEACLKLLDHYHHRMDELQTRIFQIISKNYSHIDIDDIAHLNNYLRSPLLHSEEIENNLPDQVISILNGNKVSLHEFNEFISKRLNRFKIELKRLQK